MTQSDVVAFIKTTKQAIYKYETGVVTNIPSDKIEAIAEFLQTTPAYLMGWEENDDNTEKSPAPAEADTGDERLDSIIENYNQLNDAGKDDLAKHAEHLTYIPEYKKCDSICDDSQVG